MFTDITEPAMGPVWDKSSGDEVEDPEDGMSRYLPATIRVTDDDLPLKSRFWLLRIAVWWLFLVGLLFVAFRMI